MTAIIYLIPNLLGVARPADVLPARTIDVANRITHFVVETPKVARAFLKMLSPERVISELSICPCNPADTAITSMLHWIASGHDVGIISDAGCPGMADPGAALVSAAHQNHIGVVPLVGPSSALLGLMASGFNGQGFNFHGYLPSKPLEREIALKNLERAVRNHGTTQLFIETPYRNAVMLDAICKQIGGQTHLCAAQNLASEGERIISKAIADWSTQDRETMSSKSPTLFLLGQPAKENHS